MRGSHKRLPGDTREGVFFIQLSAIAVALTYRVSGNVQWPSQNRSDPDGQIPKIPGPHGHRFEEAPPTSRNLKTTGGIKAVGRFNHIKFPPIYKCQLTV